MCSRMFTRPKPTQAASAVPATIAAAKNTRAVPYSIMPLGDSITHGSFVNGGYRQPLQNLLSNNGYSFNFVGTQTGNSDDLADPRHEGHPNYRIDEIARDFGSYAPAFPTPGSGEGRDVILIHLGTNDIVQNYDVVNAAMRLGALIDTIQAALPHPPRILVSSIIPVYNETAPYGGPANGAKVTRYNAAVRSLILQRSQGERGQHVVFVDMNANLLTPGDFGPDLVHPNQSGYNKMANTWYHAFSLLLPALAASPHSLPTPVGGGQASMSRQPSA